MESNDKLLKDAAADDMKAPTEKGGDRRRNGKNNKNRNKNRGDNRRNPKQDPFWYAKDAQSIANMATFPWNDSIGDPITNADTVPGVIVYPYAPCFGSIDTSVNNYPTRAANSYFQYVTQGFTGAVNFEAPDLLFTAIAAESLFALLCEGKRAYGCMRYYMQQNKYYSQSVIRALGFDFNDFRRNLANFREDFNIRVEQVNATVAVPKSFFIGDRWEFLSSYLFTDTASAQFSTTFTYRMEKALQYSGTGLSSGTALRWMPRPSVAMKIDDYFYWIDTLLNSLTGDDPRDMFAAIRRVYSDGELKKVAPLSADFLTTVVKHDVVSAATHNATFFSGVATQDEGPNEYPIRQSANGAIISSVYGDPMTITKGSSATPDHAVFDRPFYLLDLYDHMLNPANVLDVTADVVPFFWGEGIKRDLGGGLYRLYAQLVPRSEVLLTPLIVTLNPITGQAVIQSVLPALNGTGDSYSIAEAINTTDIDLPKLALLTHVDSHPFVLLVRESQTGMKTTVAGAQYDTLEPDAYIGEIDRYTKLSAPDLVKLNERSQFTLLSMPANSKSVTK